MDARKIKKLYKYASAIILVAALVITGYFVRLGLKEKNQPVASPSTETAEKRENGGETLTTTEDYNLIIGKIGVSAPIITNVDGSDKDTYNKALESGVAQLQGSALPGHNGNAFVFGHSSYFPDKPGNYKEVFIKLNDLIPGDIMEVQSNSARYVYRVMDKKVVEPTDLSVAAQNASLKQLTLMTCWPIGTTKQRLIIVGELVE